MTAKNTSVKDWALFKTQDVVDLGEALMAVGDRYPTRFLTERDFFPLVIAYLHGRVPKVKPEARVRNGQVNFRIGQKNGALVELAVAPRQLRDPNADDVQFPGHKNATQLSAAQNESELRKLGAEPQSRAKKRYLLLVNFQRNADLDDLRAQYEKAADKVVIKNPVAVVYVARRGSAHFTLERR